MAFTLSPYTKPSRTAQQIVAKLQAQGLVETLLLQKPFSEESTITVFGVICIPISVG